MVSFFTKEYSFLSNFYILENPITYEGVKHNSSETAFQAAKFEPIKMKKYIAKLSPLQSKNFGRKEPGLREDWEEVKIDIMKEILILKFSEHSLFNELDQTGGDILVEGNNWGDNFWGKSPYNNLSGKNVLGELLMYVRSLLRGDVIYEPIIDGYKI